MRRILVPSRDAYETVPPYVDRSAGVCHLLTRALVRYARDVQLVLKVG